MTRLHIALFAVAVSFFCACGGGAAQPPPQATTAHDSNHPTEELAQSLRKRIEKLTPRIKLGIMPLTNTHGEVLQLGEYLSETLVTQLGGAENFDLIERARLDRVLAESELSASNLLRDDAVVSIGKLLGADALVIGTITELDTDIEVNCRLVDVATGKVLGTARTALERPRYASLLVRSSNRASAKAKVREEKRTDSTPVQPVEVKPEPPPPDISEVRDARYAANQPVMIEWHGKWYDGMILREQNGQYLIHYDGYGANWDEWVGAHRLKAKMTSVSSAQGFRPGQSVSVLWNGSWYPAQVVEVGDGRWKIHYDGYGNNWDEWVGQDRIK